MSKFHSSKLNSLPTAQILRITSVYTCSSTNFTFITINFHLMVFFSLIDSISDVRLVAIEALFESLPFETTFALVGAFKEMY